VAGLLLHRPATPRRGAIPAAHVARIRTWVKYGITVPQVAAIYGVEVDEIARILGNADGKLFNLWRGSRMGHSMRVALPELSAPRSQGVDLGQPLDDAVIAEIRRALLDHQVIFFRDQHLAPEQHLAFGRRFGMLNVHDFVAGMADYPEIIEVRKEADDRGSNFGGAWHSDVTYLERPALGSILCLIAGAPVVLSM
jgi:hypothetical protein